MLSRYHVGQQFEYKTPVSKLTKTLLERDAAGLQTDSPRTNVSSMRPSPSLRISPVAAPKNAQQQCRDRRLSLSLSMDGSECSAALAGMDCRATPQGKTQCCNIH